MINSCEWGKRWASLFLNLEASKYAWFTIGACTLPVPWVILMSKWFEDFKHRHYLLSSGTLLPRTQLSCSWTDSGVVCSSAGKAAGGAGLWFLLLVREFLLREVIDGWCWAECCLWEGGKGCRVGCPWWFAGCSAEKEKQRNTRYIFPCVRTWLLSARAAGDNLRVKNCVEKLQPDTFAYYSIKWVLGDILKDQVYPWYAKF